MPTREQIGTMVAAHDGQTTRIGQVADHMTDRWGDWHVVLIDGHFENVATISPANTLGIGWRVATADDLSRRDKETTHGC